LVDLLSVFGDAGSSVVARTGFFVLTVSAIPLIFYWSYRRKLRKILNEMRNFDEAKFPEHYTFLKELYEKLPSFFVRPTLMYNLDSESSAFTFGSSKTRYVGLSAGLVMNEFYENNEGFKSVMLHELAHISNKDVEKAYSAASVVSALKPILIILFAAGVTHAIYLRLSILYIGLSGGIDFPIIIEFMQLPQLLIYVWIGIFLIITYVILCTLRNQIIRLREFYADARVLEWEKSSEDLEKKLEQSSSKRLSKFELLSKFHPSIGARILVLKDNAKLFVPSLWCAFSIGYLFGFIEFEVPQLSIIFFYEQFSVGNTSLLDVLAPVVTIIVFSILMLAVSSVFHKSFLRSALNGDRRRFSIEAAKNIAKFSAVFSFGWILSYLLEKLGAGATLTLSDMMDTATAWFSHILYFGSALVFLSIFAVMLIRRSFSQKEAFKNFLGLSFLASALYLLNRIVANQLLQNKLLLVVFFFIFAGSTYAFIKAKDKNRRCPVCGNQLLILSKTASTCPHCKNDLYSWALYPFSF
jgi:Zn-dependent protease with chaperone function